MSKYLDFISDDKLLQVIENLYKTYIKSFSSKSLKDLKIRLKIIMDFNENEDKASIIFQ